jgi:enterochelin esterase-like enzyme
MGLTSAPFIGLTIFAAVGGLAVTVWLWPWLASQRLDHIAARLGLIAASQTLAVIALLAGVNGYFLFYGSWSALLGSGAARPAALAGAAALSRPITITATELGPEPGGKSVLPELANGKLATKPPRYYANHHTAASRAVAGGPGIRDAVSRAARSVGEVLQVTIRGSHTGISSARNFVYLPPQYFQPAYAHARFPVVLALAGYPNESWSLVKFLALPATAARLVAEGKIRPAVYVMMNPSVALPRDTECTDIPAGPQVESFFAQDVPLAVERTFRVRTSGSGWSVLGYSTGGYCAAKLAMMDPYQFSAAVSMSGYYNALQDGSTGPLYGGSPAYRAENNLDWRLRKLPAPPVSVLATSTRGEGVYPGTLAFLRLIRPPMRGYSLILSQGGHNYGTWQRELPQVLEWLNQRLTPALQHGPPGRDRAAALDRFADRISQRKRAEVRSAHPHRRLSCPSGRGRTSCRPGSRRT